MQNDDHISEFVQALVQDMGFQTQSIPKSYHYKTPDFRASMCEGDMIVEVKSREDDEQLRRLLKAEPGTSLYYAYSTIEQCLYEAWNQIEFPDLKEMDFRLVWYVTRFLGGMTVLTGSALERLLYGKVSLEGQTTDNIFYSKLCFAFEEPFFLKYKNLDGVVLHEPSTKGVLLPTPSSLKLCLNPYSYGYDSFKNTLFTNVFRARFEVIDPPEIEAGGESFIVDRSVDLMNTDSIARYMKSQYRLNTIQVLQPILMNLPATDV